MLIKKHKDRFEDMETIEDVSEDILDILTLCGLKFYSKGMKKKQRFSNFKLYL